MSDGGRSRRWMLATMGGSVTLGGCSQFSDPDSGPDGESSPTATPTVTETEATPTRTDTRGTIAPDNTLRIGVLAPVPDRFPQGQAIVRGAKEGRTRAEQLTGINVELDIADTELSPSTAREEFDRLVEAEGVHATVGGYSTEVVLHLFNHLKATQTVHITTGAGGPKLARVVSERYDEFKHHFRAGPLNTFDHARAQVQFLRNRASDHDWEPVGVLVEDMPPFDPLADHLESALGAEVTVTSVDRTRSDRSDWAPVIDRLEREGVGLLLGNFGLSGTQALKTWRERGRPFAFGGLVLPMQLPRYWAETGGITEYGFTADTYASTGTERWETYAQQVRRNQRAAPSSLGAHTHDAVLALARAVEQTGESFADMVEPLESLVLSESVAFPELSFRGPEAAYAHDPVWAPGDDSGLPVYTQWQERDGRGVRVPFAPSETVAGTYQPPTSE